MPAPKTSSRGRSSQGLIIGMAILLLLLGGMVLDPQAGLACFGLAGLFSLVALWFAKGWTRYFSIVLFLVALLLAAAKFPDARRQHDTYREKATSGAPTPSP